MRDWQIPEPSFIEFEKSFGEVEFIFYRLRTRGLVTGVVWKGTESGWLWKDGGKVEPVLRDILREASEKKNSRYAKPLGQ